MKKDRPPWAVCLSFYAGLSLRQLIFCKYAGYFVLSKANHQNAGGNCNAKEEGEIRKIARYTEKHKNRAEAEGLHECPVQQYFRFAQQGFDLHSESLRDGVQ